MYELDVTLEQPYIEASQKKVALAPGQNAQAEVVIRQRRVIDLLLNPFRKLQEGGVSL